jgi:hypothetical protein
MNDSQWKQLQDELKSIGPGHKDAPKNPVKFKENVLRDYQRRSRFDSQSRWMRRGLVAVTACAAVWVGLWITKPLHLGDAVGNASHVKSLDAEQEIQMSTEHVVNQFFDLNLQKRSQEAQALLDDNAKKSPVVTLNMSNPHMTGYEENWENDDGKNAAQYRVKLTWANYGTNATNETYMVFLKRISGEWKIDRLQKVGDVKYTFPTANLLQREENGKTEKMAINSVVQGQPKFMAVNLDRSDQKEVVFAVQGKKPILYAAQMGVSTRWLTELQDGTVGELFWANQDLLAVNFQPAGTKDQDQILLFDHNGGAKSATTGKLQQALAKEGMTNAHVMHTLPGNKLRVRSGARSMIWDVVAEKLLPDPNSHDEKPLSIAKYDATVMGLPNSSLQVFPGNGYLPDLKAYGIPASKTLDLTRETGMYIINGTIQAYEIVGNELQVEVSRDMGHVQVVAVPTATLKPYTGKTVTIAVFDEAGNYVAPTKTVEVGK